MAFPRLEEERREIIQKYECKIQKHLLVTSPFGECIEKVSDMEIGQL